jgi:hypothetical protein
MLQAYLGYENQYVYDRQRQMWVLKDEALAQLADSSASEGLEGSSRRSPTRSSTRSSWEEMATVGWRT